MSIRVVCPKLHGPEVDSCAWPAGGRISLTTRQTEVPPGAACPPSPALPQIRSRTLSQFLGQNLVKLVTFTMSNQQFNHWMANSHVFPASQPCLPCQPCTPSAWGPGLAGLGATRGQVGHSCMGLGSRQAAPLAFATSSPALPPASVPIILHHGVHESCLAQKYIHTFSILRAPFTLGRPGHELATP